MYNQLELDVIEGDKGFVKMISRFSDDKSYIKFAEDLWTKLKGNEWAKQSALEDYLDWIK